MFIETCRLIVTPPHPHPPLPPPRLIVVENGTTAAFQTADMRLDDIFEAVSGAQARVEKETR